MKQKENKLADINTLSSTDVKDIWESDLVEFLKVLDEVEQQEEEERLSSMKIKRNVKGDKEMKKKKIKNKDKEEDKLEEKVKRTAKEKDKPDNKVKQTNQDNPFLEAMTKVKEGELLSKETVDPFAMSLKDRLALRAKSKDSVNDN